MSDRVDYRLDMMRVDHAAAKYDRLGRNLLDSLETIRAFEEQGELTDFSEMEFVVAGPGARDGISKCFKDTAGLSEPGRQDTNELFAVPRETERVPRRAYSSRSASDV